MFGSQLVEERDQMHYIFSNMRYGLNSKFELFCVYCISGDILTHSLAPFV